MNTARFDRDAARAHLRALACNGQFAFFLGKVNEHASFRDIERALDHAQAVTDANANCFVTPGYFLPNVTNRNRANVAGSSAVWCDVDECWGAAQQEAYDKLR